MNIEINNLCFGFGEKIIFDNFNLALNLNAEEKLPVIILGPSGCGKTTLFRLIAGTLPCDIKPKPSVSFVFQDSRFLPWFTIFENICLPLEKIFGKNESKERALQFLKLVSIEDKADAYPDKLSGGQLQRASIARAFAYPSELLLMDEPFQSLDIPLRIELMEVCLSLLENEKRLALMVTHDPREAVFMGGRIIVLGQPLSGIIFDEKVNMTKAEREYGSAAAGELEKKLLGKLKTI